jgi:hypothetical protein
LKIRGFRSIRDIRVQKVLVLEKTLLAPLKALASAIAFVIEFTFVVLASVFLKRGKHKDSTHKNLKPYS